MTQEIVLDFCEICGAKVETPTDTLTALEAAPEAIARRCRRLPLANETAGPRRKWRRTWPTPRS